MPNVDFLRYDLDNKLALLYTQIPKNILRYDVGRPLAYTVYVYLEESEEANDDEGPHLPLYHLD